MKIVVFVHTEYHLMLAINELLKQPSYQYKVYVMQKVNQKRLQLNFDFTGFQNASFQLIQIPVHENGYFSKEHIQLLHEVFHAVYNRLYFFQEQDPVLLSIIKSVKKANKTCEICLFQDGLKPYNRMKGYSLGMLKWDIHIWRWLWRNGIKEIKPFKLLHTKEYAYSDEVDLVFLTFPEAYKNWNNKKLVRIEFCEHELFRLSLEKLFCWNHNELPLKSNVILYMTQPMHHDPNIEFNFLKKLKAHLKSPLVLKLHPLTSKEAVHKYKNIAVDVYVVNSNKPAELFIMNLSNSIIVSLNSTSMFYPSPSNRYYYVSNLFKDKIKRLRRYDFSQSPAPHIRMVGDIKDIL